VVVGAVVVVLGAVVVVDGAVEVDDVGAVVVVVTQPGFRGLQPDGFFASAVVTPAATTTAMTAAATRAPTNRTFVLTANS
jgi:hypothetical protein